MKKPKTINPTEAPSLFRRIGMQPVQWTTYNYRLSQCDLVMALYIDRLGTGAPPPLSIPPGSLAKALGMSIWYACGLMYGWDGMDRDDVFVSRGINWDQVELGISHGQHAFYECQHAGLIPVEDRKQPVAV